MKGYYNLNPPKAKCLQTWNVSKVLDYSSFLMALSDLSLKMLTLKLIGLVALTTASKAQTISLLDLQFLSKYRDKIVFQIQKVIKTSRPLPKITLYRYEKPELCVVATMEEYIKRTTDIRKTSYLFASFKRYDKVTTCTLARWLKLLLELSEIQDFTAHPFLSTAKSVAFGAGVYMQNILDTANRTTSKTFYSFYFKEIASSVLQ